MLRLAMRRRQALLAGAALTLLALLRPWLESSMSMHMAIELPALFGIGWLASLWLRPASDAAFSQWNIAGFPALLAGGLVLGCWMLPVALDAAVLDWRIATLKAASMVAAGFAIGWCWRRVAAVLQAFFLFNWCAMNLTAGLLYQNAPQQLCNVYLPDQQATAGNALLAWAVVVLLGWLLRAGLTRD
ncbi:MAG TPA: hypothetical protein VGM52_18615 [Herbaspirillum sp.]|jgi:hypothetical protein